MTSKDLSRFIRVNALKMVHNANASHIGGVLSITDIVAVLYSDILQVRANEPLWVHRDRFILSKGHCCAGIYAALAEVGFISKSELNDYTNHGSRLMAHISHKVPGVEFSTGSLGHGLSFGVGKALAAKIKQQSWRTFVLLSDGEMDEGSNWEAIMFASHHQLSNLIAIIDYNKLQSLDSVANTLALEPLVDKLKAFGTDVIEVDGHNHTQLYDAFTKKEHENGKPRVVLAHTIKGKGVSFMENQVEWHYRSPNAEQLALALTELEEGE